MSLLLDSHVLEWAINDDPRLSPKAREAIALEHSGGLYVLDVTLLELARHLQARTIPVAGSGLVWLRAAAAHVVVLPITVEIAWQAVDLNWSHKDPADRLIVAAALTRDLPLATKDAKIHALANQVGLRIVW